MPNSNARSTSPPRRNAPDSSMLTNPLAHAVTVRAALSASSSPTKSAETRSTGALARRRVSGSMEAPPPGAIPTCAEAGVLGALPGVIGSLMALEVVRAVTGFGEPLVGKLLLLDSLTMRFETLRYGWDEANPLNGSGKAA